MRRLKRLNKVKIEVAARDGGGTFVGCAEKQVAEPAGTSFRPFQFLLPDLVARGVGWDVRAFKYLPQRIVIVRLFQIDEVLAIVFVRRKELAADSFVNLAKGIFNKREQIISRLPT